MREVRTATSATTPFAEFKEPIAATANPAELLLYQLVDASPPALRAHHRRVSAMSHVLATRAGLAPERALDVLIAGQFHDIGMALVPWNLVEHCETLGFQARELIKRHSRWGHDVLTLTGHPALRLAARVALEHHERWDGSGYPSRLREEDICIEARIVAICAIYDDLRRPLGGGVGISHDRALAVLATPGASGCPKFDPNLTEILVRFGDVFRRIADAAPRDQEDER